MLAGHIIRSSLLTMNSTAMPITANSTITRDANMGEGFSSATNKALLVCFLVIGSIGILGNGLVCLIFYRNVRSSLRTLTNLFIFNQSLIDLFSSIFLIIFYVVEPSNVAVPAGLPGNILCKMWLSYYPMWACFNASTFNLVIVTLERWLAIVHPTVYHIKATPAKAKMICVIPWVLGIIYQSYWAEANYNAGGGVCGINFHTGSAQIAIAIMVFTVEFLAPLTIMAGAYFHMYMKLRSRSRCIMPQDRLNMVDATAFTISSTSHQNRKTPFSKARKNVIKTLVIVSVVYVTMWGPNQVLYFEFNIVGGNPFGPYFDFTVVLAFLNMSINPFLYAFTYRPFQEAVRKMFYSRVPSGILFSRGSSRVASNTQQSTTANEKRF